MVSPLGEREHVAHVLARSDQGQALDLGGISQEPSHVAASWRRCVQNFGLEPHRLPPPTVLSHSELKDFRDPVDDLVVLARPEIDRLFARLGQHDYVLLFTDTHGVAVDFRCEDSLLDEARRTGLYLGSVWTENSQGTNGVGTCLFEQAPLSIVMNDHFATHNVSLTCTVAPIFGCEGRLEAVLDVSTPRKTDHTVQSIVRNMVANSARRIENYAFTHRHRRDMVIRLSRYEDFGDTAGDLLLALDGGGRIVAISRSPASLIPDCEPLVGQVLEQFTQVPLDRVLQDSERAFRLKGSGGRSLFMKLAHSGEASRGNGRAPQRLRMAQPASPAGTPVHDLESLAGNDVRMLSNIRIAQRVFDRGLPILLTGETGTGKGLMARALHAASRRADAPFVTINCAAIAKDLIESELFGYRPGAFTGASPNGFKGRIVEATGGTLFLDEVGDMPFDLQTRLLQVLSDGELTPVGGTRPVTVDFALISATHRDLKQRVDDGDFREDLYFRLGGATIELPPLRERCDRASMFEKMLTEEAERANIELRLSPSAGACLAVHLWPGNLRELRHVMRYVAALSDKGEVLPEHLPSSIPRPPAEVGATRDSSHPAERQMILVALERMSWDVTAAARLLALSRSTLYRKIKQYGISRNDLH
ncbi:MAG: sigma-54-dependent Fis family transcriptional regulator [Dongiaceae bacterium]